MINRTFLGEITVKIDGFNTSLLCENLYRVCKVKSLYTKNETVYLTTSGIYEEKIEKLCEDSNCVFEIVGRRGAVYAVRRYIRRFGFYVGVVVMTALIFILSNTVMRVEIVGTDDEALKIELCRLLRADGVKAGTYIPSINFLELSSMLFERCDGISWASAGSVGSVVYVNVYENTSKTADENTRIPCNIVADKDAVIVNAEVKVGRLEVLLGGAVCKGQLLVSGILEHRSGLAKYVHSYAKIIGRYEETAEFSQKYIDNCIFYGNKVYRRSVNFFDYELPLPGELLKNDTRYSEKKQSTPVKLFGFTLPISVVSYEYSELHEDIRSYSDAQALEELKRKVANYERDILAGVEIVGKEIIEERTEEGILWTVKYTLEGEIGRDSEIFVR